MTSHQKVSHLSLANKGPQEKRRCREDRTKQQKHHQDKMAIKTKTTLSKVSKQIAKKRTHKAAATAVHENSRDHKRLNKAQIRDERLQQMGRQRAKVKKPESKSYIFIFRVEDCGFQSWEMRIWV